MFDFLKKKEDPNRKLLREQFENITSTLRSSDNLVQIAAGNSINIAYSMFLKQHLSSNEFQLLPINEQFTYIKKLTDMEDKLVKNGDVPVLLGFCLFKMWIGSMVERDTELMHKFSHEIIYFSEKSDLSV